MISYSTQNISEEDIEAVTDVLRSDFLTQGPAVPAFEKAVGEYCGDVTGVAVNSGTSALHLACLALGVGPGDRVWTSPITYVASANCARFCGADVDFVDIEAGSGNMSVAILKSGLEEAEKKGLLPKVVIPVHFAGQPCDMREIASLADQYGFGVIEDAAHALGAAYQGKPVGDCWYSDVTVFSFHPVKSITTGEGGMAMSRNQVLSETMERLRSHGIERGNNAREPWAYDLIEPGYNYRMTDIQAALGISQLRRLGRFVERRGELAERYRDRLVDLPLTCPVIKDDRQSAWHLYVVRIDTGNSRLSRGEAFAGLREAGVGVNVHYMPVNRQPYYRELYGRPDQCPEADKFYETALSLPLHPGLTEKEQDYIVDVIREILV